MDRAWLNTAEGRDWLESDDAKDWLVSPDGQDWVEKTTAGREWVESLADRGYNDYIAGRSRPLLDSALTPDTAPRVGARVRFSRDDETMTGVQFRRGELAIVVQARLAPTGCVIATVRTLDGRRITATMGGTVEPA